MPHFIEWKAEDFSYKGQVLETNDVETILLTMEGYTIGIPTTDGTISQIPQPTNWGQQTPPTPSPTTTKKTTAVKTGTKKQLALDLYESMIENNTLPSRKDTINQFVTELDMTPAGASTYAAMCKKKFIIQLNVM